MSKGSCYGASIFTPELLRIVAQLRIVREFSENYALSICPKTSPCKQSNSKNPPAP